MKVATHPLVMNASKGLQTLTHRHARIVALLGIRHLVMAVNKMDLVAWDEAVFSQIIQEFQQLVRSLTFDSFQPIPVSALDGDNITGRSSAAPWHKGPSLLSCLEEIDVTRGAADLKFRMPVQWVNRPSEDFRGYCGRVASGAVTVGDRVRVVPGGSETKVRSIVTWQAERLTASAGDSITICLENEIDITRGSLITSASDPAELSDQFEARVLCLSEHPLVKAPLLIWNPPRYSIECLMRKLEQFLEPP